MGGGVKKIMNIYPLFVTFFGWLPYTGTMKSLCPRPTRSLKITKKKKKFERFKSDIFEAKLPKKYGNNFLILQKIHQLVSSFNDISNIIEVLRRVSHH